MNPDKENYEIAILGESEAKGLLLKAKKLGHSMAATGLAYYYILGDMNLGKALGYWMIALRGNWLLGEFLTNFSDLEVNFELKDN